MASFTNQATLSYNGNTVNSNTVTGNLVEVLAVSKTAVGDTYNSNDCITYIVSITNSGTVPFTGVTLTDNLGAYTFGTQSLTPLDYVEGSAVYYQNGAVQTALTAAQTKPLSFTGITVPAGGNAMIVYKARVNGFAPLAAQSTITNEASVTAQGIPAPITDDETVTAAEEPTLSITKSLSPVNVSENSELTYTFTIQNTGNTEAGASENVVITDTFQPVLSGISVKANGTEITEYTYNQTTGEFATSAGAVTVPAAVFTQDENGKIIVTPGTAEVTVTGTI